MSVCDHCRDFRLLHGREVVGGAASRMPPEAARSRPPLLLLLLAEAAHLAALALMIAHGGLGRVAWWCRLLALESESRERGEGGVGVGGEDRCRHQIGAHALWTSRVSCCRSLPSVASSHFASQPASHQSAWTLESAPRCSSHTLPSLTFPVSLGTVSTRGKRPGAGETERNSRVPPSRRGVMRKVRYGALRTIRAGPHWHIPPNNEKREAPSLSVGDGG